MHGENCDRLFTNLRETFGLSNVKQQHAKSSRQEISTKIWMFLLHLEWMCALQKVRLRPGGQAPSLPALRQNSV